MSCLCDEHYNGSTDELLTMFRQPAPAGIQPFPITAREEVFEECHASTALSCSVFPLSGKKSNPLRL